MLFTIENKYVVSKKWFWNQKAILRYKHIIICFTEGEMDLDYNVTQRKYILKPAHAAVGLSEPRGVTQSQEGTES